MDRILKLEKAYFDSNGTIPEQYDYVELEQIGTLIFSVLCLIPNAFLVFLILWNRLNNSFYNILLHVSVVNFLYIIIYIPMLLIPGDQVTIPLLDGIFYFGFTLSNVSCLLGMALIFDFYEQSEKYTNYILIGFWSFSAFFSVLAISLLLNDREQGEHVTFVLQMFFMMSVIIIGHKVFMVFCRNIRSDRTTFSMRLKVCITYVFTWSVTWVVDSFAMYGIYYKSFNVIGFVILYVNGYINFGLLTCFDPTVKSRFLKLFTRRRPVEYPAERYPMRRFAIVPQSPAQPTDV